MKKSVILFSSITVACSLLLSGCSAVNSSNKIEMVPVPTKTVKAEALTSEQAAKLLVPIFEESIKVFSEGGSQAVHVLENGFTTSNIVAVNPEIYKGMVRLALSNGEVTEPRMDENIETQLNLMLKNITSEPLTVSIDYRNNSDTAVITDDKFKYSIYMIDGKISKIVAESLSKDNPIKINYIYTYGDNSYDETIRIVVNAYNGVFD